MALPLSLLCTFLLFVVVLVTFAVVACIELAGVEEDLLPLLSLELLEVVFVESLVCRANRRSSWFLPGRDNAN